MHSEYSELDGLGKINEYVDKAIEMGHPALAITDHGQTAGAFELWYACQGKPIKPLLGTEFYISTELGTGHLVAIAMDDEGWRNILRLQHFAYTKGFTNRKPCITMKALEKFNKGIIITSACAANPIGYSLKRGEFSLAQHYAQLFVDIFGSRFYLELQSSDSTEQKIINRGIVNIANKLGVELILTNDCHYVEKEDAYAHEVLLAVQTKQKMSNEDRFRFDSYGYHFKNREEMLEPMEVEASILERALDNTIELANRCNANIAIGDYRTAYDAPGGLNSEAYLRKLTTERYKSVILAEGKDTKKYREDVAHELDVICQEGFADYYLVVQDYINYARKQGQPVGDGRGSGVASKVAYLTGITDVDPEPYNLPFERFLSHGRVPDIDTDVADRDAIIDYLMKKYGANNVATVGAFGTLSLPNCVRRVMSAFDHPSRDVNAMSKTLESTWDVDEGVKNSKLFAKYVKTHPEEAKVIRRLLGTISNYSTHAGGVLIYKGLTDLVPVRTKSEDRTKLIVTLDKIMLEKLGQVKYDILGLENLSIVKDTLDSIKAETGEVIKLTTENMEDPCVYTMLSKGDVSGVFQLANQSHVLQVQKPNKFTDLIAANSIIRPGTCDFDEYMRRRNSNYSQIDEERMGYMSETYGLYVYQEQYMFDCQTYAGWTVAYADKKTRKNKNILTDIETEEKFVEDTVKNGYSEIKAREIWNGIKEVVASGYGFCKGHATSYAVLSYKTAWLKCKYPSHFYAALMTSKGDDSDAVANLIHEAKEKGIQTIGVDINTSGNKFVAKGNKIYYRLTSVTTVGSSAIKAIEERRPFKSLEDCICRTTRMELKTNVIVNLIKAGAFDFENEDRTLMIRKAYKLLNVKEEVEDTWSEAQKLAYEKESIGLYLTAHPLDKYAYNAFLSFSEGERVIVGGEVVEVKVVKDKKGNDMAFLTINTKHGNVRCLIFSSNWNTKVEEFIKSTQFIQVDGKKSGDSLLVNAIKKV